MSYNDAGVVEVPVEGGPPLSCSRVIRTEAGRPSSHFLGCGVTSLREGSGYFLLRPHVFELLTALRKQRELFHMVLWTHGRRQYAERAYRSLLLPFFDAVVYWEDFGESPAQGPTTGVGRGATAAAAPVGSHKLLSWLRTRLQLSPGTAVWIIENNASNIHPEDQPYSLLVPDFDGKDPEDDTLVRLGRALLDLPAALETVSGDGAVPWQAWRECHVLRTASGYQYLR